jgi:hypothetical protein
LHPGIVELVFQNLAIGTNSREGSEVGTEGVLATNEILSVTDDSSFGVCAQFFQEAFVPADVSQNAIASSKFTLIFRHEHVFPLKEKLKVLLLETEHCVCVHLEVEFAQVNGLLALFIFFTHNVMGFFNGRGFITA